VSRQRPIASAAIEKGARDLIVGKEVTPEMTGAEKVNSEVAAVPCSSPHDVPGQHTEKSLGQALSLTSEWGSFIRRYGKIMADLSSSPFHIRSKHPPLTILGIANTLQLLTQSLQAQIKHQSLLLQQHFSIMKTAFMLLALVGTALSGVVERGCNADNCARAVTGTRFPSSVISEHRADCTSFFKITKEIDE